MLTKIFLAVVVMLVPPSLAAANLLYEWIDEKGTVTLIRGGRGNRREMRLKGYKS